MIKNNYKIWKNKKGTALLTAMLIMGVLMAISIALSSLVMRELRVTKDLMDAGKAFYAAESGTEEALYFLNNNLPGWQTEVDADNLPIPKVRDFGDGGKFQYAVKNQCNSYPCIDDQYNLEQVNSIPAKAFYDVMDLNETVLIPLFVADSDGSINTVKDFTVEFYGNFDPKNDLNDNKINKQNISGWDVLRWKVFGMKKNGQNYITESISDFSALAANVGAGLYASPETPSWFGTVKCDADDEDAPASKRVTNSIGCIPYDATYYNNDVGEWKTCGATQARDYYGLNSDDNVENMHCWGIGDFLDAHQIDSSPGIPGLNYLSLTNIMNPAMLSDDIKNKEDYSKIYFRVETYGDPTVREVAEIVSDGYSGNSKQSIKVMKKRDSYMPVFNFSIYSTFGSKGKDEGGVSDYYYDNKPKPQIGG